MSFMEYPGEPTTIDEACLPCDSWWFQTAYRRFEITVADGTIIVDTTDPQRALNMVFEVIGDRAARGTIRELTAVN